VNIHHFCISPRRLVTFAVPFVSTAALWASFALAQPTPTPSAAPRLPGAVPAGFVSVLEGYKPYTEEKTVNWKAANDTRRSPRANWCSAALMPSNKQPAN
jgi:hypothetical protein